MSRCRLMIFGAALLLIAGHCTAAGLVTQVGSSVGGTLNAAGTSVTTSASLSWAPAFGQIVLVAVRHSEGSARGGATTVSSVTDTGAGLTLQQLPSSQVQGTLDTFGFYNSCEVWYGVPTASSSGTLTANFASTSDVSGIIAVELSGVNVGIIDDSIGTAGSVSSSALIAFPTVTPIVTGTTAVAVFYANQFGSGGVGEPAVSSGFNDCGSPSNNGKAWLTMALQASTNGTSSVTPATTTTALNPGTSFCDCITILLKPSPVFMLRLRGVL